MGIPIAMESGSENPEGIAESRESRFQRALIELSRADSGALSQDLARLTSVAAEALGVARVSIWLFNDAQTELRCIELFDRSRGVHESGAILDVRQYPRYFETLAECRTIAAEDASTHPATIEFASGYLQALGITSMLDVPIRREGRHVGVLCNEHVGPARPWLLDEQTFAASLADLTALVLETDRRRQVETELRESLEQLELFFSQSLDGFFFMMLEEPVHWDGTTDKERVLDWVMHHQRITKVNDAMCNQYRAGREQMLGQTAAQCFAHDPAQGRELWRRMFDRGRLHTESEQRRMDGTRMWVEGDYICFYDREGRITGHFGVERDVTERKQSGEALQRYNKRLQLLQQTDRAILSVRSVHEIADAALARFHELVPCKRASVGVFDQSEGIATLVGVLVTSPTHLGVGSTIPLASFGNLDDLRRGTPYRVDALDQAEASPARIALEADGIQSLVCVPLLASGELIGTLNLGADAKAVFTQEQIEIAQEVADSLAVAIRQANLNEQVARHASELEGRVAERTAELSQANARLRASEDRVRSLYNNTPVMMHSIDENGRLLDVNEYWLKKLGYQRDEVIGQPISQFAAPEHRQRVEQVLLPQLVRDGFVKDVEVQGVKKNGERVDVQLSSIFRRDQDGHFLHSQAFLLDVTERKRAEQARRETEERLAGILSSAMDAIVAIDAERRIVVFNEAAEKVFQCRSNEVIGKTVDPFLSEDFDQILTSYMAASGSGHRQLWVPEGMQAVRKNGQPFPIEATVSRTEVSTGKLFTIILRDIDERARAEERLDELQRQNVYLLEELQNELNYEEIVGGSAAMQKVFQSIEMVAQTDSTVLLLGETGTGKELIARALHNRSRRSQNVMVRVNCGALPASLVESELFGHERGAFTGAVAAKKGRFELAHRGTIFLDETGELPLETQTKLLRVLQEQEFERLGGTQTQKVDVRVIAATNRDLEGEIQRGAFRSDLYYRLNVFPIEVPPLRDRKEDLPLLASFFVRKFSQRMGKRIHSISGAVHEQLHAYDWPGNVRELANLMERAVILCQQDVLQPKHLAVTRAGKTSPSGPEPLPTLEEAERRLILRALEQSGGVLAGPNGAAEALGINRSTLWSRARKLGIEMPKQRGSRAGSD